MRTLSHYRIGDLKVRAAVTKPNENTLTMMPVRSLVYVPKMYPVEAGQILSFDGKDDDLLLATHHENPEYWVFMGLHMNATVSIERRYSGINPVTKMKQGSFTIEPITCRAVHELGKLIDDRGLQTSRDIYYVAEQVKEGDVIDGQSITGVQKLNGIYSIEVK